jgi:twinkle protein
VAQPRARSLELIDGTVQPLPTRKLTEETCVKFGYKVGTYKGKAVQIAPYYDDQGQMVAQKIRFANKDFKVLGSVENALPFGAHAFQKTGKTLVVTEGEIDALSMSQVQGNKWPVVSLINGSTSAKKLAAKQRDYFMGFEKVVIMFDMDEPGRKAAQEFAAVIGPRAHIAELPLKDANEMLKAGRTAELTEAFWRAKQYRPEGLVTLDSLKDKAREKPRMGPPFPWPILTEKLNGIQCPYIYVIGAATGAGKTDVLRQLAAHIATTLKEQLGIFSLEEEPHTTAMGIASKVAGKLLHTPDGYDAEAFDAAWTQLTQGGKVHLYDSYGMNEWEAISDKIEYLAHSEGVKYFIVDHLTALASGSDDDRVRLEQIMGEMSALVIKLGITIFLVSHLATPEGKPHEEGGRVTVRHMKGSRAIGQWAFGVWGLERDQQAEDVEERHTTTLRILKARGMGWMVGECTYLKFDQNTGLLEERSGPPTSGGSLGFTASSDNGEPSPDF